MVRPKKKVIESNYKNNTNKNMDYGILCMEVGYLLLHYNLYPFIDVRLTSYLLPRLP